MRTTLRTMVIGVFALLVLACGVQGVLAVTATLRSAQQLTLLEQRGVVPVVGTALLSQNLDEQRTLLAQDIASLAPDRVQALYDEFSSLDIAIARSAPQALLASTLPSWRAAWSNYLVARAAYLRVARNRADTGRAVLLAARVADRLNAVLDVVQQNAGIQLYQAARVYSEALDTDWASIRTALLSLLGFLVLGAFVAVVLIRRLRDGLGNLAATAQAVARGELNVRADARGHDEIAVLAMAFNDMTNALLSAERRAASDALTGLPNHRAMAEVLDSELERAHRYHRLCSVIFLDLDHFKALNDSYGHAAGDVALQELTRVARSMLRSVDILGRWGGEEFVAAVPETAAAEVLIVAERIRAAVATHIFSVGGGSHLTCSLGVATYPLHGQRSSDLIEAADRAMYTAKNLGRNQVRSADDPAVAALQLHSPDEGSREALALVGTVEGLAALVNARDQHTGQQAQEVATMALRLALALGFDSAGARVVGLAARLHDLGKVAAPDAVLQKRGRLTDEEWAVLRKHPAVGAAVLEGVPAVRALAPLVRSHHERWDGHGYPDGLAGEAIPLGARIIAVADAFSVMTAERPYREASTPTGALQELRRCAGSQFDPAVVEALTRVLLEETEPVDDLPDLSGFSMGEH